MADPPNAIEALSTVRDFIRWGASRFVEAGLFCGHGTANALDEAAALVLYTLHLPYDLPADYFACALTAAERERVAHLIEQRISLRKPAAYLTHEASFAGLSFYVDERVLVPRSPIAELIEQRFSPWLDSVHVTDILDLCTGSGCIAIACAYAFPEAAVDAADISRDALEVAEINIKRHGVENCVRAVESNLYDHLGQRRYDLIVSNPPYVNATEWQALPAEYHAEPKLGLEAGETGLDCIHRILRDAADHLKPEGILVVEVGSSAKALQAAYPDVAFYWLDFERGGEGVFLLTSEQVSAFGRIWREQTD